MSISRREFLVGAGSLIGAGLITGCEKKLPNTPPPEGLVEIPTQPLTFTELKSTVENLPQSHYKDFILENTAFFFQEQTPHEIKIGDIPVKIYGREVKNISFDGKPKANITLGHKSNLGNFTPKSEQKFNYILPSLYPENPEDVLNVELNYVDSTTFHTGLYPVIEYYQRSRVEAYLEDFMLVSKKFVSTKEIATLAYEIAYMKEMAARGSEKGQNYLVETKESEKTEFLTLGFRNLLTLTEVDVVAFMIDRAGYLIAIKAMQSDPDFQRMLAITPENLVGSAEIMSNEFGSDSKQIVRNATLWIMNNHDLLYNGNFGDPAFTPVP